ncbi:MAG TPA: TAT-variant-translocated molybdopterin oxidoreductase [Blastocatellia bacterium]|nr:TAT-variant-translocated molybdopterin oxidoreductase [Blastocatellia bacterium]
MPNNDKKLDLVSIQSRTRQGRQYWRSLEELAETEEFQQWLHREFPSQASEFTDPVGRRRFLKLMGASLALAGVTACTRQPTEKIAPYLRQPEGLIPGKPWFYATAMPFNGVGMGLLVESHEGRPTKVEGNPEHPSSLGATDIFAQASLLTLYDPDRSQVVTYIDDPRSYAAFLGAVRREMVAQQGTRGGGLRILTGSVTSPTLADQMKTLLAQYPSAKWHQYDPAEGNAKEGARLAFGQYANTVYRFDQANLIVSLDSDFLTTGPASVRYSRDFMTRRRIEGGKAEMNRLYVIESTPNCTGAAADQRLPLRASEILGFASAIAAGVGVQAGPLTASPQSGPHANWVNAIVNELNQNRGNSLVVAGEYQPPAVHALAHSINQALGNVGRTVVYTDPVHANPVDDMASLVELARDLDAGLVDVLLIIGSNPVYTAPADLDFGEKIKKARMRIHSSLYKDETSELCQWHIPEAHYLESWSDVRAYDGTVTIIQPLIAPLYSGKTAHEVVAAFSDQPERSSYDIIREYWQRNISSAGRAPQPAPAQSATPAQPGPSPQAGQAPAAPTPAPEPAGDFESAWRRALHDGFIANSALAQKQVSVSGAWAASLPQQSPADASAIEILFRPDPTIYDGQFSNNGWLQELPKPISKLTWDNAALISPATARRLGVESRAGNRGGEILADQIEIQYHGRSLVIPVWVTPGQPDNCITLHLGYGRRRAGRVGTGTGFNAYSIRTSDAPWQGAGAQVSATATNFVLAATQLHHMIDTDTLEQRDIVRAGTLEEYRKHPEHGLAPANAHGEHALPSLYPEYKYEGYAWGMAIDISACTGCSACVVACQAENNIPVVGKEQVRFGREMQWLRIDSYHKGGEENPETYFQPVPCMHCEKAPCEVVCPVAATVHSAEGLNDMVYNRCVGTRYCSNNCPYKVRRFNFLLYQDFNTASLKLLRNPDVSVRSRGVMEKCTYCVQRIQSAKIEAEKEDRRVRDGEIKTACQQVCPTEAIIFGDINDPNSRVAKLKAEPRNYGLLAELNTRPRTTYMAAVRNPNPELEKA